MSNLRRPPLTPDEILSAKIANLEKRLAAEVKETTEAWRAIGASGQPAFEGLWVNSGGGSPTAAFLKDPNGFVWLRGAISNGTLTTTAFTLPAGYRPSGITDFVAPGGAFGATYTVVRLNSAGQVTPNSGSNAFVHLDGIRFRAEA